MGDEFVNLQPAVHIVIHETTHLGASLYTTECTALPGTASNKLEGFFNLSASGPVLAGRGETLTSRGNLLARRSDTNDDALAPSFVTSFQCAPHNMYVAGAVECVVTPAVSHIDQPLLDRLAVLEIRGWIDEVCGPEFLRPIFLRIVDVDCNDPAGTILRRALNDGQADASRAKNGHIRAFLNSASASSDGCRAIAGGDTAAEQAGSVHWSFVRDGHERDICNYSVLREGRAAHEMQ